MATPQQTYIDNLKDRVETLYDDRFLFDTIDENGDILGYVDRTTGQDIVDTDDFFNHENFGNLADDHQMDIGSIHVDFYTSYDDFMVYVIKDI